MRGLLALVLAASVLVPFGGRAHRRAERGNREYREGNYGEALRAYTQAQVHAPNSAELHYDIGNVLFRQDDHEGAAEAYTRALLMAPPELEGHAAYNLGNALYRMGRWEEAAGAYRRALEADPADRDAKRNLELALRNQERSESGTQGAEPSPGSPAPDDGGAGDPGRDEPPGAEPTTEGEGEGGPEEPEAESEARPSPPGDGTMTPEQARRLLDGLEEEELANLREEMLRQARREDPAVEEDW
jgi:Ca-activated chloride channel family protein